MKMYRGGKEVKVTKFTDKIKSASDQQFTNVTLSRTRELHQLILEKEISRNRSWAFNTESFYQKSQEAAIKLSYTGLNVPWAQRPHTHRMILGGWMHPALAKGRVSYSKKLFEVSAQRCSPAKYLETILSHAVYPDEVVPLGAGRTSTQFAQTLGISIDSFQARSLNTSCLQIPLPLSLLGFVL